MRTKGPTFEKTGYGQDFEIVVDVPPAIMLARGGRANAKNSLVRLKAYDMEADDEPDYRRPQALGFRFECVGTLELFDAHSRLLEYQEVMKTYAMTKAGAAGIIRQYALLLNDSTQPPKHPTKR